MEKFTLLNDGSLVKQEPKPHSVRNASPETSYKDVGRESGVKLPKQTRKITPSNGIVESMRRVKAKTSRQRPPGTTLMWESL